MNAVGASSAAAGRGAQDRPAITATATIRRLPYPAQPRLAAARMSCIIVILLAVERYPSAPCSGETRSRSLLSNDRARIGPRCPRRDCFAAGKPGSHTPRQVRDVSRVDAVCDKQSLNDRVRQGVAHRTGDPFASRYLVAVVRMHRTLLT